MQQALLFTNHLLVSNIIFFDFTVSEAECRLAVAKDSRSCFPVALSGFPYQPMSTDEDDEGFRAFEGEREQLVSLTPLCFFSFHFLMFSFIWYQ